MAPRNAVGELADLVVNGWLVLHGYDVLRAGWIDVLGVGPRTRLALERALRQRIPESRGLGGGWEGGPPGLPPAGQPTAPEAPQGALRGDGSPGADLDRFLAVVLGALGGQAARSEAPGAPGEEAPGA